MLMMKTCIRRPRRGFLAACDVGKVPDADGLPGTATEVVEAPRRADGPPLPVDRTPLSDPSNHPFMQKNAQRLQVSLNQAAAFAQLIARNKEKSAGLVSDLSKQDSEQQRAGDPSPVDPPPEDSPRDGVQVSRASWS